MSLKSIKTLALVLILTLIIIGCAPEAEVFVADDNGATSEGTNAIVEANNKFAFNLYSEYKSGEGNIFFSPYSISTALAMTYEGARGKTAEEMRQVFYFPEDDNLRKSSFASIYNEINKKDKAYKLSTANALWAQKDYSFLEEYVSIVENYYGGKATNLDFIKETEESRQTINGWIEDQTNDKIKDLIPVGALNKLTRLVITNAVYFKGTWVKQFEKKDTREEDFTTSSGQKVKTPMMRLVGNDAVFSYAENDNLQILELPYNGENLSMLVILPKEDLMDIEKSINSEKVSEWKNRLRKQRVDIFIPKFKFETKYLMAGTLAEMGMPTAFSDSADFTGMEDDPEENFKIDKVIHQAFVEVNEEGTEAAAATAVIMTGITSVGPPTPIFRADHPFIFIIQQKSTGNILFMGRVSNPTS